MRMLIPLLVAGCSGTDKDEVSDDPVDTTPPVGDTSDTEDTGTPPTGHTADTGLTIAPPLELCINEFMPGNVTAYDDGTQTWPDWIEIHNPGTSPVDLMGWSLTDDRDDWQQHVIAASLPVAPGGFVILLATGSPELGTEHLSFALDQQGEEVALFRADGSGEIIAYGEVVDDLSISRPTDCGPIETWEHVFGGTPGVTNE